MELSEAYRSPVLHGYVLDVENLAEFPVLVRVQEIDFAGMVAIIRWRLISMTSEKASEAVQERFCVATIRTWLVKLGHRNAFGRKAVARGRSACGRFLVVVIDTELKFL